MTEWLFGIEKYCICLHILRYSMKTYISPSLLLLAETRVVIK